MLVPCASLDKLSIHADLAKEILFSMHTVFRIGELELIQDRLWYLKLTLTHDNDEQLKRLTDYMRSETKEASGTHRLGRLMIKWENLTKLNCFFRLYLKQHPKMIGQLLLTYINS